jgi:hypothetical protein
MQSLYMSGFDNLKQLMPRSSFAFSSLSSQFDSRNLPYILFIEVQMCVNQEDFDMFEIWNVVWFKQNRIDLDAPTLSRENIDCCLCILMFVLDAHQYIPMHSNLLPAGSLWKHIYLSSF